MHQVSTQMMTVVCVNAKTISADELQNEFLRAGFDISREIIPCYAMGEDDYPSQEIMYFMQAVPENKN